MGSLSKSYGYNVGKRDPAKSRTVFYKGERRAERWPSGVTERFVNLVGNAVTCQLLGPGVPRDPDTIARARAQLHRAKNTDGTIQGFVEHDKCPLRHAANLRSPIAEEEFAEMPDDLKRPCAHDTETRKIIQRGQSKYIEYLDPCPHVMWLMETRRQKAAQRSAARMSRNVSALELEKQKLELAKQQIEEQRKANEKLVAVVESAVAKPNRKATTE